MLPIFCVPLKPITLVILIVALAVTSCQPSQNLEDATATLSASGATVIVPTLQQVQPTPTVEPLTTTGNQNIQENTPAATIEPVVSVVVPPTEPAGQVATPTSPSRSALRPTPTMKPRPAVMNITRPGAYSKLSSPIKLEALISPGEDGLVYVNLIGEDGRIIVSQILDFRGYDSRTFFISPEIPFQINSAAELGRIVVFINDQFGQIIQLISVDVILIQYGDSDETPNEIELEPYMVRLPGEGALINGGILVVEGSARLVNDSPLFVDLVNEKGMVVGTGETQVSPPSEGSSHMPFQVIVPYSVDRRTRVRMTLRQESTTRIPGTVWLSSSVIFLDP